MLRLENIKITNEIAEADFYPEQETKPGHIVVNLQTEEIDSIVHVPGYEFMYPGHARETLVEMSNSNDKRTERIIMWY